MTPNPPNNGSKQWAGGRAWITRSINTRDHRPHSPCPDCYADCVSDDTGSLLEFRCPRGHTHIQARPQAIQHSTWLARYTTGEHNR